MPAPKRLLILGGTAEARRLAAAATARFGAALAITTSLAGRTQAAAPIAGGLRRGGFGGAAGLLAYLRKARIDVVIDATHPFAARISESALAACRDADIPLLAVTRPPWRPAPDDRWIEVGSAAEAAALLPARGKRVFLTIGRGELGAFAGIAHVRFLVRLIEPPSTQLPLDCELILGRGPFTLEQERTIIERHAIDLLVTKASGGAATAAKLSAARAVGIPVVMLRRPEPSGGASVERIEDAVEWLEERLVEVSRDL
ncbi:MAG TPA: cobalt-precorrin-6A reductase [Stellaceae bacterium]